MALKLNNAIRSKIVDSGIVSGFGTSGILRVYGGTRPGTGGEETTQGVIVEISGIAWSAASNGTTDITDTVPGTAGTTGTSVWARLSGSDGTSYVIDGLCGTAAECDFWIDVESIEASSVVSLYSAIIIQPAS